MKSRMILASLALALAGCGGRTVVVDGTEFALGCYLPLDGQLYGLQILRYRNGTAIVSPSNTAVRLERDYSGTNSYLGVVHTADSSQTTAVTQ